MSLEEFREYVNKHDQNRIKGDGIADIFNDDKQPFAIICKKCGSMNVEVLGEKGSMGSELTGYMEGESVVKCLDCGNAVTVWE